MNVATWLLIICLAGNVLVNRKPAQASSSPFCSDTRGHDTHEGASFENGKPASDASARRERTIPGQPTMVLALQSLLTRLSITSTSACMVGLGRLLSTSVNARGQTSSNPAAAAGLDSLCSGAQLVLTRVQNLTADYLAQNIENQMERLSRNSSANLETTMSDDFNVTDTLELASEKLTRCCGRQTSPSDSITSSLVACLEQEKVDQDLQKLRGFLAEFNETSMVPVTEQILRMEKVLKQGNSSLQAGHTSSPLDAILQSVTRLEKLTRLLSGVDSSSLAESSDIHLLLCSSLFPECENGERLSPCPSTCQKADVMLRSLAAFLRIESIPVLHLLNEAKTVCLLPPTGKKRCLLALPGGRNGAGYKIVNASSSQPANELQSKGGLGFCLHTGCKSPLRATSDENHRDKDIQKSLTSIYTAMASVFPDGMLPLNRSILPCGRDCSTIGFTAHDHRASQVVLSIFSSISVASIIFSFVVYFFNRHNLARHFLRRATMMFLACAGLGESIYMFSAKGATSDSILCYSDGTLVTHPTSSDVWCWWTAIQSHLFSTMAIGYTIVLTYTWHQVAQLLSQPGSCRKNSGANSSMMTWWTNYQRDFVSFVLVLIPSLGVVIAVSAQQGYEALPLFGVCSESAERGFVGYYTWYHVAAIIPNMIFLIRGVHVLVRKHGVLGVVRWVKDDNTFGNSQSTKRRATVTSSAPTQSSQGLRRFSLQMLLYLFLFMVSFILNIHYGLYVQTNVDDWSRQMRLHIECQITSCSPDSCPPLPKLSATTFLPALVFSFTGVFIFTTWAYSVSFLGNVPGLGFVINRCRSIQTRRFPKVSWKKVNTVATASESNSSSCKSESETFVISNTMTTEI